MKKILSIIFAGSLLLSACSKMDFGDINTNVNGAKVENASAMMSGGMMRLGRNSGREYLSKPMLYVQYLSQRTYTDEMLYNEAQSTWFAYYVQTISNFQSVIKFNSDPANLTGVITAANGQPANQIAVARIMKAVVYKRITDAFGNIPYEEALNQDVLTPKYSTQEYIYKDLIKEVKEARDMMVAGAGPTGDIFYLGNMTAWKKFANSFLLSLSLQLSKKYPTATDYAATEFKAALANAGGLITTKAEEAWFLYDVAGQHYSPWNEMRAADYKLSLELTNALQGVTTGVTGLQDVVTVTSNRTKDKRIEIYAAKPTGKGLIYGYDIVSGSSGATAMSAKIWNNFAPLPLMTAAYTYLNRAEGAARGWTTEDANAMLSNGIIESYASLASRYIILATPELTIEAIKLFNDAAPAFAAARVADVTTAPGGALQVIAEEKWIALFANGGHDAWAEWRRSGYPMLKPATDALNGGVIPRRFVYPVEEPGLNKANYESGVAALVPATDSNKSKVWWDQ